MATVNCHNCLLLIKNFVLPMLLFDYGYWLNKVRHSGKKNPFNYMYDSQNNSKKQSFTSQVTAFKSNELLLKTYIHICNHPFQSEPLSLPLKASIYSLIICMLSDHSGSGLALLTALGLLAQWLALPFSLFSSSFRSISAKRFETAG